MPVTDHILNSVYEASRVDKKQAHMNSQGQTSFPPSFEETLACSRCVLPDHGVRISMESFDMSLRIFWPYESHRRFVIHDSRQGVAIDLSRPSEA